MIEKSEQNYKNLFNYKIIYSKKRRRTIAFKIIDGVLNLISPKKVSEEFLINLIRKREYSILNMIKRENKDKIIQENKIIYLGNKIDFLIYESDLLYNGGYAELKNNILYINISKNYSQNLLETIIKNWLKIQCKNIIYNKVKYFSEKYNFSYRKISIRERKSVWGTCNIHNDLVFNWKIIMYKNDVIDYLIIHELTHTIYKNHSNIFWLNVEKIIPNYKLLDNALKEHNTSII